jgi:predicted RNase H-like nuclease (RuvC/YqgF family)
VRKIIVSVFITLVLSACAANHGTIDAWQDASLVTRQRAEIEQLKRDIADMGANQREVSERIDSITAGLAISLERCKTVEDIFAEIDRFVRELIDENSKLRSLQQTDRPADAGE